MKSIIGDKSFLFALEIIKLYKCLTKDKEFQLSAQVLRSGTSIGANAREAEQAQSKMDFIHKMNISLKEANETEYWLELLYKSEYIQKDMYINLQNKCVELKKMLIAIIKTSKRNLAESKNR